MCEEDNAGFIPDVIEFAIAVALDRAAPRMPPYTFGEVVGNALQDISQSFNHQPGREGLLEDIKYLLKTDLIFRCPFVLNFDEITPATTFNDLKYKIWDIIGEMPIPPIFKESALQRLRILHQ